MMDLLSGPAAGKSLDHDDDKALHQKRRGMRHRGEITIESYGID